MCAQLPGKLTDLPCYKRRSGLLLRNLAIHVECLYSGFCFCFCFRFFGNLWILFLELNVCSP